jgi:hypothetical protein
MRTLDAQASHGIGGHHSCGSRAAMHEQTPRQCDQTGAYAGASLVGAGNPGCFHRCKPRRRDSCAAVSAANTRTQAAGT